MIEWLDSKNIEFPNEWRRRGFHNNLKDLCKKIRDEEPDYNAEQIAREYGHEILRLPRKYFESKGNSVANFPVLTDF